MLKNVDCLFLNIFVRIRCQFALMIILFHAVVTIFGEINESVPKQLQNYLRYEQQQLPYTRPYVFNLQFPSQVQKDIQSEIDSDNVHRSNPYVKRTMGLSPRNIMPLSPVSNDELFLTVRQRKSNNLRNMMRIGKRNKSLSQIIDMDSQIAPRFYERNLAKFLMFPRGF